MIIKKRKSYNLNEKLVTDKQSFLNRRAIISGLAGILTLSAINKPLSKNNFKNELTRAERPLTKYSTLTRYNNFFEFGTTKEIWKAAQKLDTSDWSIKIIGGEYDKKIIDFQKLIKHFNIEERIYRFRCVEAWSMIVPWTGFELSHLISFLDPGNDIKYVSFKTFFDPKNATNQKQNWYPWPYREIITIEEARNKLAFIATGVYGESLPKQNGAPLRLILPWKYGFKSIKSIVEIEFLKTREKSFWETIAPKEYGFWANVNPKVPHKRWSQEFERDIETKQKHPTIIFNGYEKWVKYLYPDIDNDKLFY